MEALPMFPTLVRLLYHFSGRPRQYRVGRTLSSQCPSFARSSSALGSRSVSTDRICPVGAGGHTRRRRPSPGAAAGKGPGAGPTHRRRRLPRRSDSPPMSSRLQCRELPPYIHVFSVFAYDVSEIQSMRRLMPEASGLALDHHCAGPIREHVAQECGFERQRPLLGDRAHLVETGALEEAGGELAGHADRGALLTDRHLQVCVLQRHHP